MTKKRNEKVSEQVPKVEEQLTEEQHTASEPSEGSDPQDAKDPEDDWKDKYLRLFADFDNFKKRTARERVELFKNAGEEMVTAMLPVLDDFDRGMAELEKNGSKAELEGIKLIHTKFKTILEQAGLKWMDSKGKKFDPDFHEAITETPAPSRKMKGKVVEVIEKGYSINDKIIRYAKVVVGK